MSLVFNQALKIKKDMGNAKLKAEELVNEFSKFTKQESYEKKNYNAIECALIAVEEIIDSLQIKNYSQADQYEYWSEVKYYIENYE